MKKKEITKKHNFVKKFAIFQLSIGFMIAFVCLGSLLFPWVGLINLNGTVYEISEKDKDSYQSRIEEFLSKEYPEYNDSDEFWESFAKVKISDLIIDTEGNISFCVAREYTFLGLKFGDISGHKLKRYLVEVDGNYEMMESAEGQNLCGEEDSEEKDNSEEQEV